ncbi:batten's disease protein Cln3 [Lipomyces oligophaga]|uniref:batten's disease protein Cln3 n=1 Tax=Lipomyces oligophaga TaxID=45792 RepID=UPI0034CE93BA
MPSQPDSFLTASDAVESFEQEPSSSSLEPDLLRSSSKTEKARLFTSFWVFGLLNNVLYVIILSAAVDLVGADVPKAVVLLADVLPSFIIKLLSPFFVHLIPYTVRIWIIVALSLGGMQCVALLDAIPGRLFGVVIASTSCGIGETTFLQLTHFFEPISILGFSSGTGGAGLVGSFFYLVCTTWLRLPVRGTIFASSLFPLIFFAIYYGVMPVPDSQLVARSSTFVRRRQPYTLISEDFEQSDESRSRGETRSISSLSSRLSIAKDRWSCVSLADSIFTTAVRLTPLFFPYMLPLMLVYIGEYIINQGVTPTLLFPLDEMPFGEYRDAYVTYGTLYQLGVFISRSSSPFFRIRKLYIPAGLQLLNMILLILQSLYSFIPNVYFVMLIIFYEGLLGGAAYINTFLLVGETVSLEDREFSLGAVSISDSSGVVLAATICLFLEPFLCSFQKSHDRPYCGMT